MYNERVRTNVKKKTLRGGIDQWITRSPVNYLVRKSLSVYTTLSLMSWDLHLLGTIVFQRRSFVAD